jgi:hypothetical protein
VSAAIAPVVVEYVLALQSVHATLPVTVLNFPATQAVHVPPSGPVEPAGHANEKQSSSASLPTGEDLPAPQSVQPSLPVPDLYLPASQAEHDPPSGPL